MVTIEEIREVDRQEAREHISESIKNFPYVYVLKRISPYFTRFFIEYNISANQITFCSIMLGIIGNFMFVFGNFYSMLLGCFFYQFWNLFDCVDGEIARVTNVKTAGGKYLETISVVITECAFVACLGIGLSKILDNNTYLLFGLIFALFICLLGYFARTRDVMIEQFEFKNKKTNTAKMSYAKRVYKKARLFFVIYNGYLILTVIVVFELIFPIKLDFSFFGETFSKIFGETLNITSIYFLLYGFVWTVRTLVSSITNYRHLMRD